MSNQQRPFSWFRLAPFGRQLQPAPAPTPPPTPRPTAFRAPAPQPFRPPAPQPRPTIRPSPPAVTSPPPPAAPTRALFPGITTTTTTTPQPVPRSPTPSTAPGSPAKSIPATSVPASPIIKLAPSSSPTSPTLLPITTSSFSLRSPETNTPAPYSSSLTTNSPFPKSAASPPKTAPPAASSAPTTATTILSSRIVKPSNESPPKNPEKKPLSHPPAQARAAPQEDKKLMLGQAPATAGNSKMTEKSAMDNKNVSAKFEKLPRRLVTLIGDNKGAIMVLNPSSTKKSHTTNVFGGKSQTVGNKEEGKTGLKKKKKEDQNDTNTMEMEESTLFINGNVQGVNNSILDDSSLTDHDPGFHIFFSTD